MYLLNIGRGLQAVNDRCDLSIWWREISGFGPKIG